MIEIEKILSRYPKRQREFLIPVLQDIQDQAGYLPADILPQIALHVGLPLVKIYSVATYYNQFQFSRRGRFHLQVCEGSACLLEGGRRLGEEISRLLEIRDGEVTHDQMFSLEMVPCLGACHLAPVMSVNGKYYGKMSRKELIKLLDRLRRQDDEQ